LAALIRTTTPNDARERGQDSHFAFELHVVSGQATTTTNAAGRVGPGGVVGGGLCYDRALGGLHPEVGETDQFERVGFPLGEQVVHFRVVFVVGPTVVARDAVRCGTHGVAEITGVGFHSA